MTSYVREGKLNGNQGDTYMQVFFKKKQGTINITIEKKYHKYLDVLI